MIARAYEGLVYHGVLAQYTFMDWMQLLGGLLGAAALFLVVGCVSFVRDKLVKRAAENFVYGTRLTKLAIRKNRTIQDLLQKLLDRYDAARVCVYQFHNGQVFMLADHSWKVSCTHEVVADGVTHTLNSQQALLVSQAIDWVDPIVTGETTRTPGCAIVDCPEHPDSCPVVRAEGRYERPVFRFNTEEMQPSNSKWLAAQNGVGGAYTTPLRVPGNLRTKNHDEQPSFGFVGVQFRTLSDMEATSVETELCHLCQASAEIQYLLHESCRASRRARRPWWKLW